MLVGLVRGMLRLDHCQTAERGWLQMMKSMELLAIEAAITGDYGTALQAFISNPLVPSGETATRVMHELLIAHKAYLPQFADTIARLEKGTAD